MPSTRRRWMLVLATGALFAGGAVAAWRAFGGPEVAVIGVAPRDVVQTVVSSGRVMPPTEVTLSAFTSSTVAEVSAAEGDVVKPGQLLAKLDDRELVAAVNRGRAAVARASAGAAEVAT